MNKRATLVLLTLLFLIPLFVFGTDRYARYKSWRELSATHISDAAQWYLTNRAKDVAGVSAICVYALDCADGHARLAIVGNLDEHDFKALRQLIWTRRFAGTCQGQTANLGLHLLRSENSEEHEYSDHAIWSFHNNRFIPMYGSWSGGAFSEEPWERCSMDSAAFLAQRGVVQKTDN